MKNTTKNIKFVPTYACKLGKGKFVGGEYVDWQCSACGFSTRDNQRPSLKYNGGCPSTASGNHMWVQI